MAIATKADAVNPVLSQGWLDYAQHRGFVTDTTRVRKRRKARVERQVPYVRNNFWAGESFADLNDAQARVAYWASVTAGLRVRGTTHERPAEAFADRERAALLAVSGSYDVPEFKECKVHREFHIEVLQVPLFRSA